MAKDEVQSLAVLLHDWVITEYEYVDSYKHRQNFWQLYDSMCLALR
jgi:hypothetical protein